MDYWILDTGYWMLDTGYWILDIGYWILDDRAKYARYFIGWTDGTLCGAPTPRNYINMNNLTKNIHRLGHASFRFDLEKCIYIDPYQLSDNLPKADIIICTHSHFDHCSPEDIAKIQDENTTLVVTADSAEKVSGNVQIIAPGESLDFGKIKIEAVPAYNTNKSFHPKENGWMGIIVDDGNIRIYHTGDTDDIPEMKNVEADVWLVPVSGTYVMTAEEAAEIINNVKPQVAIPMHYGAIVGSKADAGKFADFVGDRAVILD